jgi:hypothetical protein
MTIAGRITSGDCPQNGQSGANPPLATRTDKLYKQGKDTMSNNGYGTAEWDYAQILVMDALEAYGVPTEEISDAGTVENLLSAGLTLRQIAGNQFTRKQLNAAISWL